MMKRAVIARAATAASILLLGCNGSVSGGEPADDTSGDNGGYDVTGVGQQQPTEPLGVEPRLVRLSHAQYQSTLQDLFGIDDNVAAALAPDSLNGFVFSTSNDLRVDARLGPQYRQVAEELAERAVSEEAIFDRIVTCDTNQASCADTFIQSFGERAFRRPLTSDELATFKALFTQGGDLVDSGDDFRDGVQVTLEAMLQSPQLLYRTELSSQAGSDGRVTLSGWERASRLSYFLYDSMPDADLFQRARAGQLETPAQVSQAVTRMLAQPRAVQKLVSFHEQVWQFGKFSRISPDAARFPEAPSNIITRVQSASDLFIESVIDDGGGLKEFLTAPYAFADSGLAPLYDTTVSGNQFARIDLTSSGRKGFLMQVGFLASNAYSIKTDPIHRGLFVIRDLLCRRIPDPPPGAAMTPPPKTDVPIKTTREEINLLTGQSFCPTCHGQINPPGFAFEGFDALGQSRTSENGVQVDTTGEITLDGKKVQFSGAGQLVDALAVSEEARSCYARRWLEFAYGRPLATDDLPTRDAITKATDQSVEAIISALVASPQFLSLKQ
jgi:hypothetical protein